MPLFSCEIELHLSWSKYCLISEISRTATVVVNPRNSARDTTETTSATFRVYSTRCYVAVVNLSINDNIKLLKKHKARI